MWATDIKHFKWKVPGCQDTQLYVYIYECGSVNKSFIMYTYVIFKLNKALEGNLLFKHELHPSYQFHFNNIFNNLVQCISITTCISELLQYSVLTEIRSDALTADAKICSQNIAKHNYLFLHIIDRCKFSSCPFILFLQYRVFINVSVQVSLCQQTQYKPVARLLPCNYANITRFNFA